MSKEAPRKIEKLAPDRVKMNWEGDVDIIGSGFVDGDFPFFDGKDPSYTFRSANSIVAHITREITGTLGRQVVKVHTIDGDLSNEVPFDVF